MKRYGVFQTESAWPVHAMRPHGHGQWVQFADAQAAITAAVEAEREKWLAFAERVAALDPPCPKPIGADGSVMRKRQELADHARQMLAESARNAGKGKKDA